jgi:hypothetical protein
LFSLVYFTFYLYFLSLIQNLVFDNHRVELGTQGKNFILQVARRGGGGGGGRI